LLRLSFSSLPLQHLDNYSPQLHFFASLAVVWLFSGGLLICGKLKLFLKKSRVYGSLGSFFLKITGCNFFTKV
jgi:hypothetical protein